MLTSRSRRSQAATARSARSSTPATTTPTTRSTTNSRATPSRCPLPAAPGRLVSPSRRRTVSRRPGGRIRGGGPDKPGSVHSDAYRGACASRPPPGRAIIHLAHAAASDPAPARHSSSLPAGPRTASPEGPPSCGEQPDPLLGFAPGEVCHTSGVAAGVVGSYPTVSPLPDAPSPCGTVARRSVLCCTVCRPRVGADARGLPGTLLFGARTFLHARTGRGDGRPASCPPSR